MNSSFLLGRTIGIPAIPPCDTAGETTRGAMELVTRYNYDEFTREKVLPWLNFEDSPTLGQKAPDFPLWHLDGRESRLSEIWSRHVYTIVEFGSFT